MALGCCAHWQTGFQPWPGSPSRHVPPPHPSLPFLSGETHSPRPHAHSALSVPCLPHWLKWVRAGRHGLQPLCWASELPPGCDSVGLVPTLRTLKLASVLRAQDRGPSRPSVPERALPGRGWGTSPSMAPWSFSTPSPWPNTEVALEQA